MVMMMMMVIMVVMSGGYDDDVDHGDGGGHDNVHNNTLQMPQLFVSYPAQSPPRNEESLGNASNFQHWHTL
jgi:hypothetical protein